LGQDYQPQTMYQLDEVYSFEGYVIDSWLQEPESSFLSPTPEYTIEIQPDNPCTEQEVLDLFESSASPHTKKTYPFRGAQGIKFTSVVKPRVPKGIMPGTHVVVRAKPTTNGVGVTSCALTLVTVLKTTEAEETDWSSAKYIDI
jgi:hypothetical protein